jgi:hypothetical protein
VIEIVVAELGEYHRDLDRLADVETVVVVLDEGVSVGVAMGVEDHVYALEQRRLPAAVRTHQHGRSVRLPGHRASPPAEMLQRDLGQPHRSRQ